jgi:hypothetical protein
MWIEQFGKIILFHIIKSGALGFFGTNGTVDYNTHTTRKDVSSYYLSKCDAISTYLNKNDAIFFGICPKMIRFFIFIYLKMTFQILI